MSDNFELQCHFERLLLININEEAKNSNDINNIYKNINYSKFYIIIVCSQNSLSGTEKHFQHNFLNFIKKMDFELLSKVDATPQGSRISTSISRGREKNYNVRTRVYYKKNMVHLLFDPKKFSSSYNRTKFITTRWSKSNNRRSNSIKNVNNNANLFSKYPFIMTSYNIFRETYDKKDGLICINLNFKLLNNKILSLLIINQNNDSKNEITGGANTKVRPLLNKNLFIEKFKLQNNTINITICTPTKIKYNNNKLKIKNIDNKTETYNYIDKINDSLIQKRCLLKIPYLKVYLYKFNELGTESNTTQIRNVIHKLYQYKDDLKFIDDDLITNFKIKLRNLLNKNLNQNNTKKLNFIQKSLVDENHIMYLSY